MLYFIRNSFTRKKLQDLYLKAALSNFVGFVAGSTVMMLTTYQTVERRALKNLFGILPRQTVVVHRLPEWLEWALSILLGYLVMEFVRYIVSNYKSLLQLERTALNEVGDDGEQPTNAPQRRLSHRSARPRN
jgi:hypothetical protein